MYKKHKIPKKIVDKIKQRNKLNKEIEKWCNENLDMDGMCSLYADITRSKFGDEQGTKDCKEWCAQSQKAYSLDWIVSNLKRFGKTVFLTQEEAEQKLKEMESK